MRRPVATYRVQLRPGLGFRQAKDLANYLHRLGVSDLYTSPILKASPGSTHGYDVTDPNELNPELGTRTELDQLAAKLKEKGMGLLLDFVPNHVAIGHHNPFWLDVLENGPSSIYAHFFDIDWNPIKEELKNQVLVPVLGDQYGAVLERGELSLSFEQGGFQIHYFDFSFPVAPRQYALILNYRIEELRKILPEEDVHFEDLLSIIVALSNLPSRHETSTEKIAERNREKEAIKRRIAALCDSCPAIHKFINNNVRIWNGIPGKPESFDLLDNLLRRQAYRLAYWRVAAEEINYRRFFDINELAAICMEDPRVLQRTHSLVFQLVEQGKVTGLRIDHPDGLYEPVQYFARLQEEFMVSLSRSIFFQEQPWRRAGEWEVIEPILRSQLQAKETEGRNSIFFRPFPVIVEKILARNEKMPENWPVDGTTGYDFMNLLHGLFIDERNAQVLDGIYAKFTGLDLDYAELVYQKRLEIMKDSMSSEVNVLARQLSQISEYDRRTRDFTLNSLRRALVEIIACFPVYRTYITLRSRFPDEHDRHYWEAAVRKAKQKNRAMNVSIFYFLKNILVGHIDDRVSEEAQKLRRQFVLRLQQFTAPVMAKAVEDTVFYIYNRLVSLNEVGGQPDVIGTSLETFHSANKERAEKWSTSLSASSTHDTKRSEDVRTRIHILSEIPGEWKRRLAIWSRLNRRFRSAVGEAWAPDRNEEYLLYQILAGTWPTEFDTNEWAVYRERMISYMQKAIKEAKINTSWVNPNELWEKAVSHFVFNILHHKHSERFIKDFTDFASRIAHVGALHSLSQVILKTASPGICDIYQGTELWDDSLVDPDNRRPINFLNRDQLLQEIDSAISMPENERKSLCRNWLENFKDGRIKLFFTSQALRLRRQFPRLFRDGQYFGLTVEGEQKRHIVAFIRKNSCEILLAVTPRRIATMLDRMGTLVEAKTWGDTMIIVPNDFHNVNLINIFTGEKFMTSSYHGAPIIWLRDIFTSVPYVLAVDEQSLSHT